MLEAEQGIIGCVLTDESCIDDVWFLKPEMFEREVYKDIYNECLNMRNQAEQINIMSLATRLENHKYEKETLLEIIKECLVVAPSSTWANGYADTIIKEYKSRTVKELFSKKSILPKDIDETIADVIRRFEALVTNQTVNIRSIKEIVAEYKDKHFVEDKGLSGIKTGFYELDSCLGDLEKGDVTVVAARPSVGKSAFVVQVVGNMCKKGMKVGYFNLEMSDKQVFQRMVSRLSQIGLTRVKMANTFLGDEKERYEKALKEMESYDLYISNSRKISEIKQESKNAGFDVIVIDHLQLTQADKYIANRAAEIGANSRNIKSLAMELGIHVILISQLNRGVEIRDDKEPDLADLRDSGDIEQDASNVIMLWNMSKDIKDFKAIKIAKNRQGELSKYGMKFRGDLMEFEIRNEDFKQWQKRVENIEAGQSIEISNEVMDFE